MDTLKPRIIGKLEKAALAYHEENPEVWRLVHQFAAQAKKRGFEVFAIDNIWGAIRWERTLHVGPEHEFKMPNNHRAYYARWYNEVTGKDFFRTCRLRSLGGGTYDEYGREIQP